jgi:hypothetical protein
LAGAWSIFAGTGATAGDEVTDERAQADPDGDGLVGMAMDGFVGGLAALGGLGAGLAIKVLAAFEGGGEALAGLAHLVAGHVGGGGHQGTGVVGELGEVVADCLGLFFHMDPVHLRGLVKGVKVAS